MLSYRIGQGFDVHQLVKGRPLILAGVLIPYEFGLEGHSDADVMIHSVIDALLGAAGLGDIGEHFSDQDPHYKNIDSRIMLRHCEQLLHKNNWTIENIDVCLLAEAPKISPYKTTMQENLATDLKLQLNQVNVKATTTEKLGFIGRKEGMACQTVALLSFKSL